MRAVVLVLLAACTRPPVPAASVADLPARPADQLRHYTLWLGGARIGTATERETWSWAGVHLRRVEQLRYRRGASLVALATTIDIDADPALVATRVDWTERDGSGGVRAASAVRVGEGWRIEGAAARPADGAQPAELLPLLVRRDGRFAGAVFLPARGFVGGAARVAPVGPGRLVARLSLAGGVVAESTIDLGRDGTPARVVDGEGVIALRATAAQAAARFRATDLIALTAVPIAGVRHGPRLVLDGDLALPPVPGQAARPTASGVEVVLGAGLPGAMPPGPPGIDRSATIAALVAAVRARIAPDLGAAPTTSPADAVAATAGDCTTFALAYAAVAAAHGIPTRLVTGFRIDGGRLVRHRWDVSWTGRAWIAVDAAFGGVPAGGDLIGLAVDDADDVGLVAGDGVLGEVRAAVWAGGVDAAEP